MNSRDLQRCVEATRDAESQIKMILETLVTRLDQLTGRRHAIHAIAVGADKSVRICPVTIDADFGGRPDPEVMASIRRILSEKDEDAPDLHPRRRCRHLGDDECEEALMKEWAAIAVGDDMGGDAGMAGDGMAAEWEAMLDAGDSTSESATAVAKDATRALSQDEIDAIDPHKLILSQDELDELKLIFSQDELHESVFSGKITAELYIVDINYHCNGVSNTGAIRVMEKIIGREFFEGRLRMNANQLVQLLLAQREQLNPISQYEIVRVQRDKSGLIDVSGS